MLGVTTTMSPTPAKLWDIFVSHASEDKASFVRPLAEALVNLGATVWYDEFSLRLGDSPTCQPPLQQSVLGILCNVGR